MARKTLTELTYNIAAVVVISLTLIYLFVMIFIEEMSNDSFIALLSVWIFSILFWGFIHYFKIEQPEGHA